MAWTVDSIRRPSRRLLYTKFLERHGVLFQDFWIRSICFFVCLQASSFRDVAFGGSARRALLTSPIPRRSFRPGAATQRWPFNPYFEHHAAGELTLERSCSMGSFLPFQSFPDCGQAVSRPSSWYSGVKCIHRHICALNRQSALLCRILFQPVRSSSRFSLHAAAQVGSCASPNHRLPKFFAAQSPIVSGPMNGQTVSLNSANHGPKQFQRTFSGLGVGLPPRYLKAVCCRRGQCRSNSSPGSARLLR